MLKSKHQCASHITSHFHGWHTRKLEFGLQYVLVVDRWYHAYNPVDQSSIQRCGPSLLLSSRCFWCCGLPLVHLQQVLWNNSSISHLPSPLSPSSRSPCVDSSLVSLSLFRQLSRKVPDSTKGWEDADWLEMDIGCEQLARPTGDFLTDVCTMYCCRRDVPSTCYMCSSARRRKWKGRGKGKGKCRSVRRGSWKTVAVFGLSRPGMRNLSTRLIPHGINY
jgi:hypothetical protein